MMVCQLEEGRDEEEEKKEEEGAVLKPEVAGVRSNSSYCTTTPQ